VKRHDARPKRALAKYGRQKIELPVFVTPQLATLVTEPPKSGHWLYEVKYDGYRMLARLTKRDARIFTRSGKDWTDHFPTIAEALTHVRAKTAVFDGEIAYVMDDGRTDFQKLQNALGAHGPHHPSTPKARGGSTGQARLVYFVFDLLHYDGVDLTGEPLEARKDKLRTILAALGMIIGVGAVIAMVSIGNGAKAQVEAQIASLGQNVISVFPGSMTSGGMRGGWGSASTLSVEDADAIKREVPGAIGVSVEVRDRQQVQANGLNWNTQVSGVSPDYLGVRAWPLADGEFFTENDVRTAAKVCVIGKTVADQLFSGSDPIGQNIRVRNIPMRVVGVLAGKGFNFFGQDQDDVLLAPYTTAMKRVTRRDRINSILIQSQSPELMERIQADITSLLQQRRQGREPDFTTLPAGW
jgi:hypothetical protein